MMNSVETGMERGTCNERGPNGYHCTETVECRRGDKIPHRGPHVARSVLGGTLGSEIVRWGSGPAQWNPAYTGR